MTDKILSNDASITHEWEYWQSKHSEHTACTLCGASPERGKLEVCPKASKERTELFEMQEYDELLKQKPRFDHLHNKYGPKE